MLASEIVGKEVIGANGFKIGKIMDTEFDENTWKLRSLAVQLEKDVAEEHNLRHRFRKTRVLISVDHVQGVGDRVILRGSKEDLLKLIATATSTVPEEEKQPRVKEATAVASSEVQPSGSVKTVTDG